MNVYNTNPFPNPNFSQLGHGYRNACWRPAYAKNGKAGTGHIVLFGYDSDNNPKKFSFPFCPSVKYEVKYATKEKDLYGKFIETKWFDNTQDRRQWCEAMDGKVKIISSYSPEQEFLLGAFRKYVYDKDFNQQPIRTHFIDIEVAIEKEFPEPEDAKYPINLITVYDSESQKFYSWALNTEIRNTLSGSVDVELRKFQTEEDLLHDYLEWHVANYPDIFSGYNCKFFDSIYIINRMEKVLGGKEAKRYSPVGSYRVVEDKKNFNKKYVMIKGISVLDMMFLYRDKFGIKQALDGGYSLNNVSSVELDDEKLKLFEVAVTDMKWDDPSSEAQDTCRIKIKCLLESEVDGLVAEKLEKHYGKRPASYSISKKEIDAGNMDFYKKYFQEFWEYNVQDVKLVVKLEKKLQLLKIARRITSYGCANYEEIYKTISYIIASQDIFARNNYNKTFISYISSSKRGQSVEQYEGAFVFPTQAGLYKQGIVGVDVNSLYPNTAISLNLSPETMVGTVVEKAMDLDNVEEETKVKEYIINFVDGRRVVFNQDELDELLATKCTISRNNVLFIKHEIKKGIFSEWCRNFFTMRKGVKKHLAALEQEIRDLESRGGEEERIKQLKVECEIDDATQYALKIMINSAYGTLGTTYSPIYDVRLAEAITGNGQFANRSTSMFLNKLFKEEYGCPENFNPTISGDTDSVTGDTELQVEFNEENYKQLLSNARVYN